MIQNSAKHGELVAKARNLDGKEPEQSHSVPDLATVREGGTVAESFRNPVPLAPAAGAGGYSDFYRLADRLHSYEIVAGLFLKTNNEQK